MTKKIIPILQNLTNQTIIQIMKLGPQMYPTRFIITDNNKFKEPLNLETKCPVCSQMFSNEEIAEHANVCPEAKFEESANSKEEKEQPSEDLQAFQNLADQHLVVSL